MEKNDFYRKNLHNIDSSPEILNKIADYYNISISELSEEAGYDRPQAFYDVINGKTQKISHKMAERIMTAFPKINKIWLLTGEGSMLKGNDKDSVESSVISPLDVKKIERNKKTAQKIHEVQTIPLYDSVATLGLVEMIRGSEKGDVLDYISIPNLPKSDGAIFMTGDSMYPLLKSGDIVALKIINKADIVFGEIHYIEYMGADFDTEFKVIKYVKRSEKGEDFIQLVSYNQHHEPKDININQIKTIAIVNASIRYNRL